MEKSANQIKKQHEEIYIKKNILLRGILKNE